MNGFQPYADAIRHLLSPSHDKEGLTSLPSGHTLPGSLRFMVMAEPSVFRLSGEINAWMKKTNEPDAKRALIQWRGLHAALKREGVSIDLLRQPLEWPDYVFTANAGLAVLVNGVPTFIPSQFKCAERQGEQPLYEKAFLKRGYQLAHLFDADESWEGEGDFLQHNGTLFGGYGWRSRVSAHQKVANYLGLPLITLHLVNPHFYHLDTALAFLDERTVLWYPAAFEEASRALVERHVASIPGGRLIAVDAQDAARFACNAIPVGQTVFMNEVSDGLVERLKTKGFTVRRLPLSEFLKSGGAAKCLVAWSPAFSMTLCAPLRSKL